MHRELEPQVPGRDHDSRLLLCLPRGGRRERLIAVGVTGHQAVVAILVASVRRAVQSGSSRPSQRAHRRRR